MRILLCVFLAFNGFVAHAFEPSTNLEPNEQVAKPIVDDPESLQHKENIHKTHSNQSNIQALAFGIADRSQNNISQNLHRFSNYVDKAFSEENYVEESLDSRLRISLATRFQKHLDPTFQPRINLALALPNTKNRLRLRLQSNDDGDSTEDSNIRQNLQDSISSTTLSSALGLLLLANDTLDIRADAGVRFRSPIDPFTRLRIRKEFRMRKAKFRFTETFEWRDSLGKTASSLFEFNHPVRDRSFFRSQSEIRYLDIGSYWTGRQTLSIFKEINNKTIIAFSTGVSGQNEDDLNLREKYQVNEYWFDVRYRKTFYKNWLAYQVSPGITHPREVDFDPSPRIELRLEALYGNLLN